MKMSKQEKLLIFRTCGMVLWVLKEGIYHSQINESKKVNIIQKINSLIKPITDHVNDLRQESGEGKNK